MSLTQNEITKLKELVKDPVWTSYSYKDRHCLVNKKLSAAEFQDWKDRIDAL